MKKVALYPFNKITQGLIRFSDLLNVEVCSVLDFVFSVGKDAKEELTGEKSDWIITDDIEKALEGVDALIINDEGTPLGHFEKFYRENELDKKWRILMEVAHKKGLEIISTHLIYGQDNLKWMEEKGIKITYPPKVTYDTLDGYSYENLRKDVKTNLCKVAIYGTRSCIGKFTAQQTICREMKKKYKVSTIVTEPTAFLFDAYPTYNVHLDFLGMATYLRKIINDEEEKGTEYLFVADQGSIAQTDKLSWILTKMIFIKGFSPDKVIIIADYNDDHIIEKMIEMLKVYTGLEKPSAILIPDRVELEYGIYEKKTQEEMETRKKELKEKFKVDIVEPIQNVYKIVEGITN